MSTGSDRGAPGSHSAGKGSFVPPSIADLDAILDAFEFIDLLGSGGMGAVYKARQKSLDRLVAIKILPPALVTGQDEAGFRFAERFQREARAMAMLNHPNIVLVYDFGQARDGQWYFVMEYVEGTDLHTLIRGGQLTPDHVLSWTSQICDALSYAHTRGIIHRDIKPANIMITREGQAKVADFGLAKLGGGEAAGQTQLTTLNFAMGTPDYIAPEALDPDMEVDHRADLFSLGVMLYEMLTGKVPRGVWKPPSVIKPGLDPRYDDLVAKAMESERSDRFQDAAEITRSLHQIATTSATPTVGARPRLIVGAAAAANHTSAVKARGSEGVHQPHRPPTGSAQPPATSPVELSALPKRPIGLIAGLATAALVALGLGAFFLLRPNPEPEPVPHTVQKNEILPAATPAMDSGPPSNPELAPVVPASLPSDIAEPAPAPQPATVAAVPDPPATPADLPPERPVLQTLDLLAIADPQKDRIPVSGLIGANEWVRENGVLIYRSDAKAGKLAPPVTFAAGDYEVELLAERLDGQGRLHLDLPVNEGRILPLILDDPSRKVVHEKSGSTWPADAGNIVHVAVRVIHDDADPRQDRLHIRMVNTGTVLANVTEDFDSLGKPGESHPEFPDQSIASLFSMKDSYAIRAWIIRVFEGEVSSLREPKAALPSPVPDPAPLPSTPAAPPAPPEPAAIDDPRLTQLDAGFRSRYDAEAENPYQAALVRLNQSYVANGIARARAIARDKGSLEEVTALDAEKQRVDSGGPLPPADLDTLPHSLKQLRATYRSALGKLQSERAQKAAPIYDLYLGALDAYITELTRANDIDRARQVRIFRDRVDGEKAALAGDTTGLAEGASQAPGTGNSNPGASLPAPAASGEPIPIPPEAKAPVEKGRHSRELITWVSNRQSFRVHYMEGKDRIAVDPASPDPIPGDADIVLLDNGNQGGDGAAFDPEWLEGQTGMEDLQLYQIDFPNPVAFRGMKELQTLRLEVNPASNENAMRSFPPLPRLRILTLPGPVGDEGARILSERCPSLGFLSMRQARLSRSGMQSLARIRELNRLDFQDGSKVPGPDIAILSSAPSLQFLAISRSEITTPCNFSGLTNLTEIYIDNCRLGDSDLTGLAELKNLSRVNLPSNSGVTAASLPLLAALPKLTGLNLGACSLTDEGMAGMPDFRSLEYLDLTHNSAVADAGCTGIARQKNLTLLVLSNTGVSDLGVQVLSENLRNLIDLRLDGTKITDAGVPALRRLRRLERLVLSGTGITDTSVEALSGMNHLRELRVEGTQITPAGVAALQKALPQTFVAGS